MKQKEEKTRKRYAMVVELKKCFNCKGCVVACRAENKVPLPISRNWIEESGVRGRYPLLGMTFEPAACNHCEDPPCERVCPTGATFQSPEGIVLVDNRKCVGMQVLHPGLSLRRPQREPPGQGHREVHLLQTPPAGGAHPGLRGDLHGTREAFRRYSRSELGGVPAPGGKGPIREEEGSGNAARLLLRLLKRRQNDGNV